jgi:hypothetical protein
MRLKSLLSAGTALRLGLHGNSLRPQNTLTFSLTKCTQML